MTILNLFRSKLPVYVSVEVERLSEGCDLCQDVSGDVGGIPIDPCDGTISSCLP